MWVGSGGPGRAAKETTRGSSIASHTTIGGSVDVAGCGVEGPSEGGGSGGSCAAGGGGGGGSGGS